MISTMSEKSHNVFISVILFLVLNLQICFGENTYQLSSAKNICFMFDGIQRTFEESKQFCQNNGGSLLEIHDDEMQRLVENFGRNKSLRFVAVWLNLVRTKSNEWVWGGEGSENYLTYSNWERSNPSSNGAAEACMNSNYKWLNVHDQQQSSTICMHVNGTKYLPETQTTTTSETIVQKLLGNLLPGIPHLLNPNSPTTTTTRTTAILLTFSSTSSLSSSITTTPSLQATYATSANSVSSLSSSSTIGIGVGVGLGGLVLIIVSSLLVAKFVFHKEIPLPFKSSRGRNSPPRETGSDVINDGYEQIKDNKLTKSLEPTYSTVVTPGPPSNSTLKYVGFQDLIQPSSDAGVEGLSKADYGTSLAQTLNAYDNVQS